MILSRFYFISNFRACDGSQHHLKMTFAQQSLAKSKDKVHVNAAERESFAAKHHDWCGTNFKKNFNRQVLEATASILTVKAER